MRLQCRLREFRGRRGLSIRELEVETGISRATLSRIERGVMLPADPMVASLERAYGEPIRSWYWPLAIVPDKEPT